MIQRSAEVLFITYIISPTGGSTRNNKQCKGKMKLHKNKQDMIAGSNGYHFIQSVRRAGIKNNKEQQGSHESRRK